MLAVIASALGCLVTVGLTFPGYMSYDSVWQLEQGRLRTYSDWHPPVMAFVWGRIDRVVAGPAGMLVLHHALFWASVAALSVLRFPRSSLAAAVAPLAIGFFPPVFAMLGPIWKDAALGVTLLAAFVLLLVADCRQSRRWVIASLPLLLYAMAVRHNAAPALVPFVAWAASTLVRGRRHRIVGRRLAVPLAAAAMFVALLAGRAAIDFILTDEKRYQLQALLLHDLTAISISAERNQLPRAVQPDRPLGISELQRIYTPERTTYLFCCDDSTPRLATVGDDQSFREIRTRWAEAVAAHPRHYLRHRWQVARQLFGLGQTVCVPYFVGVEDNDLGIVFHRTLRSRIVTRILETVKDSVLFRGWVYLILSVAAVAGALAMWRRRPNVPFLVLTSSALLYLLPYFFVATACDFRLLWWGVVAMVVSPLTLGLGRKPV